MFSFKHFYFYKSSLCGLITTLPNLVLTGYGLNDFGLWATDSDWFGIGESPSVGLTGVLGISTFCDISGNGNRWCLFLLMAPEGLSTTYERGAEWDEITVASLLVSEIHTGCPGKSWGRSLTRCLLLYIILSFILLSLSLDSTVPLIGRLGMSKEGSWGTGVFGRPIKPDLEVCRLLHPPYSRWACLLG